MFFVVLAISFYLLLIKLKFLNYWGKKLLKFKCNFIVKFINRLKCKIKWKSFRENLKTIIKI